MKLIGAFAAVVLAATVSARDPEDTSTSGSIVGRFLRSSMVSVPKVEMGVFREITTISGSMFAGNVHWAGRNAILITGDQFDVVIPLTVLGEKDFQVFGFQENRSSDGKFWYERKRALENERGGRSQSADDIEDCLGRLRVVSPLIESYERRFESLDPTVIELERFVRLVNARAEFSPDQWHMAGIVVDEFRGIAEVVGSTESRRIQDQTGKLETLVQSAKDKILLLLTPVQRERWQDDSSRHSRNLVSSESR